MDPRHVKTERRNRPPVSCEPCRNRKLKCNRSLPCDTCERRGKASACHFAANASRKKPGAVPKPRDVRERLNTLESLLSSFVAGNTEALQASGSSSTAARPPPQPFRKAETETTTTKTAATTTKTPPPSAETDSDDVCPPYAAHRTLFSADQPPLRDRAQDLAAAKSPHFHESEDGRVNCIDPSHWLSILDDIKEIREHLSTTEEPIAQGRPFNEAVSDASLVFGSNVSHDASSFEEILQSLPPRPICDLLLSWYFNGRYMVLGIIHPAKFQHEYALFWESRLTTSPLWVALLFSILGVSISLRRLFNLQDPPNHHARVNGGGGNDGGEDAATTATALSVETIMRRTAQLLVLGKYATANAHALEAFILHLMCGFFAGGQGGSNDQWFEMGTAIRLALRMGYHRDPRHMPQRISPFDGEMRRRVWCVLQQIDALMSFEMGFPSMIPIDACDADTPRNLEYSDLRVDMEALPPSRPLSQSTSMLYTIVKSSVMHVFRKIVTYTQFVNVSTARHEQLAARRATTRELDVEMKRAYASIPESYIPRNVADSSFLDDTAQICQRCTVEILYRKSLIVLHRWHISYQYDDEQMAQSPEAGESRQTCVEAALDILARQADLHRACAPGGRLHQDRWVVYSLPAHDFLTAAMVIALDLSVRMRSARNKPAAGILSQEEQQLSAREYRALQTSQRIWKDSSVLSPSSSRARVAAVSLDLMITKVNETGAGLQQLAAAAEQEKTLPVHPEAFPAPADPPLSYADSMSHMIEGYEDIDWALIDQYFLTGDDFTTDVAL